MQTISIRISDIPARYTLTEGAEGGVNIDAAQDTVLPQRDVATLNAEPPAANETELFKMMFRQMEERLHQAEEANLKLSEELRKAQDSSAKPDHCPPPTVIVNNPPPVVQRRPHYDFDYRCVSLW